MERSDIVYAEVEGGGEKMRLKLSMELENENLPIQYRRNVISFIKLSLSQYDEESYKKYYNNKDNIIKPYTFSVFFRYPQFKENIIIIKDRKIEINFSIAEYDAAIILYNAFNHQKNNKFSLDKNSWTLKNINIMHEKDIDQEEAVIKFMSPLVVRERIDKKDYYYSYSSDNFLEQLKNNIKEQLKISKLSSEIVNGFNIEAVQAKKVIVKFYEKKIETSTGIFRITGDKQLLNYLYQAGIGSKRSSGFGMFKIL